MKRIGKKFGSIMMCAALAASVLAVTGCDADTGSSKTTNLEQVIATEYNTGYSKRDISGNYSERTVEVSLSNPQDGEGVVVGDGTITLTQDGTYIMSGDRYDGTIVVNADHESDKVQIVLAGNIEVSSKSGPAIVVTSAKKTFVTVKGNAHITDENCTDWESVERTHDYDATIYAEDDITFNGEGTLSVSGHYKRAIRGTDIVFAGDTNVLIDSEQEGIRAKNSVKINSFAFMIQSGDDGITCENTKRPEKGYVLIDSNDAVIVSGNDCIQASDKIIVNGSAELYAVDKYVKTDGIFYTSKGAMVKACGLSQYGGTDEKSTFVTGYIDGKAESIVRIVSTNGEEVASFMPEIDFSRVVFIANDILSPGLSYTIECDGNSVSASATDE